MKIGDRIKDIRLEKNISQKELSIRLGIPRSTLANYENNNREPNLEILGKIADMLSISVAELLTHEEKYISSINTEGIDVDFMLNTSDCDLAIFFMLKKFRCFNNSNLIDIPQNDLILMSKIISNNVNSTIHTFIEKRKQDLIDKFENLSLSEIESSEISIENDTFLKNTHITSSNSKISKVEGLLNKYKSIKKELRKLEKNNPKSLEQITKENEELYEEGKNLQEEIKALEQELYSYLHKNTD